MVRSLINLNFDELNSLENKIHLLLVKHLEEYGNLTINNAAELCDVSTSKISKFIKKIGFKNYKQYCEYFSGNALLEEKKTLREFEKIKNYIDNFDPEIVHNFVNKLSKYEKIIIIGYGPTFIIAEYFAYKLKYEMNKFVFATQEDSYAINTISDNTLILGLSVTGKFKSFKKLSDRVTERNGDFMLILEDYNKVNINPNSTLIFLTNNVYDNNVEPYIKSRTLFMIFIEEVISTFRDSNIK